MRGWDVARRDLKRIALSQILYPDLRGLFAGIRERD
jgi:hypothetical protein